MTELAYRPDQAAEAFHPQERLVFVDPADTRRQFEINRTAIVGGDSADINQAVEAAYRDNQEERNEAATRTPEHVSNDAELAQAIDWNAQAMVATRDHVETNGF